MTTNESFEANATIDCGREGEQTADEIFAFVIDTIVVGILCFTGIIGNTLTVVTFGAAKQTSTTAMLIALAVADGLYLAIHGLLFMCLRAYFDNWERIEVIEFPIGVTLQACSVLFILLVAVDRYLALCWGFEARKWSTLRNARIQIIVAAAVAIALNFPRFFVQEVVEFFDPCSNSTKLKIEMTPFGNQPGMAVHGYVYMSAIYILPIAVLFFVNIRLIMVIRRSRIFQRRNSNVEQLDKHDNSTTKTTVMLCGIIFAFLVCQIPYAVNQMLYATKSTMEYVPQKYYNIITNMLVVVNSVANFFIYVVVGKTFRQRLKSMLTARCRAHSENNSNARVSSSPRTSITSDHSACTNL